MSSVLALTTVCFACPKLCEKSSRSERYAERVLSRAPRSAASMSRKSSIAACDGVALAMASALQHLVRRHRDCDLARLRLDHRGEREYPGIEKAAQNS